MQHEKKLYGTATVGSKGQVVIPADAREELNIQPGDRLYVIGSPHANVLSFIKEEQIEQFLEHISANIENFRSSLKKEKE